MPLGTPGPRASAAGAAGRRGPRIPLRGVWRVVGNAGDAGRGGRAIEGAALKPGLYIVGTPIGNLDDIAPRALETLRQADGILTEDTRHTRILLERYGIRVPMISCHKFNEAARLDEALARMRAGAALALVTDSGMPVVSDPGARIVSACHAGGVAVSVVPGPSAVTAAVALAGFCGGGFLFQGFLPRKPGARLRRVEELLRAEMPVVLFESPYRLLRLVADLRRLAPTRRMFVGRELTKKFEEHLVGTPEAIGERFKGRAVKGEVVVVIAPERDSPEEGCRSGVPAEQ
jgi:16S rRNA (cytidine1402-2'-O)-methyltransferase